MVRSTGGLAVDAGPGGIGGLAHRGGPLAAGRAVDAGAGNHPSHERGVSTRGGESFPPARVHPGVQVARPRARPRRLIMALPPGFQVAPPPLGGRVMFRARLARSGLPALAAPPDVVAPLMPPGTRPDTFDGDTFVALVPFELRGANFFGSPAFPYFGDFLETNVRLYSVDDHGRHGVVFASLETSRLAIALAARTTVGLPYTWSHQTSSVSGSRRTWTTRRRWPDRGLRSEISIEVGPVIAEPDDLAVFLTARWGLHTERFGRTVWMPNVHEPWELQQARVTGLRDQLVRAAGLPVAGAPDVPTHVLRRRPHHLRRAGGAVAVRLQRDRSGGGGHWLIDRLTLVNLAL